MAQFTPKPRISVCIHVSYTISWWHNDSMLDRCIKTHQTTSCLITQHLWLTPSFPKWQITSGSRMVLSISGLAVSSSSSKSSRNWEIVNYIGDVTSLSVKMYLRRTGYFKFVEAPIAATVTWHFTVTRRGNAQGCQFPEKINSPTLSDKFAIGNEKLSAPLNSSIWKVRKWVVQTMI